MNDSAADYDVAVVGGGPLGLAYATWLKQDRPETRIVVLEKRAAPGFKIGESTLVPTVSSVLSLGPTAAAMRRLFHPKFGLWFWWMGQESQTIEAQVDPGNFDETFQLERRVFEIMLMRVAERQGVEIRRDTRVDIAKSTLAAGASELVCESSSGESSTVRARLVCDASGPASVIPRALGLHRQNTDFTTNAYWAYFRKKSQIDFDGWDVTATRHLCFPEGWVWFIEIVSWEDAPEENLAAMIDYLLDLPEDAPDYPTRQELAERFGCPYEQVIESIGVVPRTDIDTASGLPPEERFDHYVHKYPAFKAIMDTYELVEEPYKGLPTHFAYSELVHYSEKYAGDGWLAVGDAAFFVNPFLSPGLTYGFPTSSLAAKESAAALEAGDLSAKAFAHYDETARATYEALVAEHEMFYRCFRHPLSFEKPFLVKAGLGVLSGRFAHVLSLLGGPGGHKMPNRRLPGPVGGPGSVVDPRYLDVVHRIIETTKTDEEQGVDPGETAKKVEAIVEPFLDQARSVEGFADLRVGRAFEQFDDNFQRVAHKDDWQPLIPRWRCPNCGNDAPMVFDTCYACGEPNPHAAAAATGSAAGERPG
jgi:flavin-dependent dehydrogenase